MNISSTIFTLIEIHLIIINRNNVIYRSYNQHWLIQEAEQRRLAGGSTKPQRVSPSMNQQINNQMNMNQNYQQNNGHHLNNMMMTSPISQGGDMPPSPNHINTQSPVYENSSYVNHQQVTSKL